MSEEMKQKIADAAEVIVDGYAMLKCEIGIKVVSLYSGHVTVFSDGDYNVLESNMDDIETVIARDHLKANRRFMED